MTLEFNTVLLPVIILMFMILMITILVIDLMSEHLSRNKMCVASF